MLRVLKVVTGIVAAHAVGDVDAIQLHAGGSKRAAQGAPLNPPEAPKKRKKGSDIVENALGRRNQNELPAEYGLYSEFPLYEVFSKEKPPGQPDESFAISLRKFYEEIGMDKLVNVETHASFPKASCWLTDGNCASYAFGMRMDYNFHYLGAGKRNTSNTPTCTTSAISAYVGPEVTGALRELCTAAAAQFSVHSSSAVGEEKQLRGENILAVAESSGADGENSFAHRIRKHICANGEEAVGKILGNRTVFQTAINEGGRTNLVRETLDIKRAQEWVDEVHSSSGELRGSGIESLVPELNTWCLDTAAYEAVGEQGTMIWPPNDQLSATLATIPFSDGKDSVPVPSSTDAWKSHRQAMYSAMKRILDPETPLFGMVTVFIGETGAHLFNIERFGRKCFLLTGNGDGGGELAFSPALPLLLGGTEKISAARVAAGGERLAWFAENVAPFYGKELDCAALWENFFEPWLRVDAEADFRVGFTRGEDGSTGSATTEKKGGSLRKPRAVPAATHDAADGEEENTSDALAAHYKMGSPGKFPDWLKGKSNNEKIIEGAIRARVVQRAQLFFWALGHSWEQGILRFGLGEAEKVWRESTGDDLVKVLENPPLLFTPLMLQWTPRDGVNAGKD